MLNIIKLKIKNEKIKQIKKKNLILNYKNFAPSVRE